ncbi:ABC transporter [Microbacterium sp. PF5]|uniref:ABC transporter n=1 Tax=Microbacterium sp. PF5 TaxID=2305435 RepID=UPI00109BC7F8|nr:ABC transporter [Microbacterium sp. PF5]
MNLALLRRAALAPSALLVLLAAAGCASPVAPAATADPDAHGIDSGGAAEVAAPALALAVADERGALTLLDLDTEERVVLTDAGAGRAAVSGDGRLVFLARTEGDDATVDVVDTGRWTVPHGDHTHSFRGEPRQLGSLDGHGEVRVSGAGQSAAIGFDGAEVVLLPHDDLTAGLDAAPLALTHAGPVLPFADRLLVPTASGTIRIVDGEGAPAAAAEIPCGAVSDADLTRVGAVFACAEGAVLFTRQVGGEIVGEAIPYPAGAPAATRLDGRADRPDLAGVAGDDGAWLLDVRQRTWTLIPSDVPLIRAVAIGDDAGRTVAVDAEGRLRVLAPDGSVLARTEPLLAATIADPALRDRVELRVSARRVYVADPAAGTVYEIDNGDARITRTFSDLEAVFLQLVG